MTRHDDPGTPAVTLTKWQAAEFDDMLEVGEVMEAEILALKIMSNVDVDALNEKADALSGHCHKMEEFLEDLGITER